MVECSMERFRHKHMVECSMESCRHKRSHKLIYLHLCTGLFHEDFSYNHTYVFVQLICEKRGSSYSVHELSQFDLEVYGSEALPDAPEVGGNLAGLYCSLY